MVKAKQTKQKTLRGALSSYRMALRSALVGREDAADGIVLGMLSGQNVLLLGEPGTAKSCLARLAAGAVEQAQTFFAQLHPAMPPEDLFGPYDLPRLKATGEWARRWQRFLPAANIVLLDEVFRGSDAILDTLLKAVLEHKYSDDGVEQDIPVRLIVGTTNSVPDEPHLQAFFDRWPLRYFVRPPSSPGEMAGILGMADEPSMPPSAHISLADVDAARAEVQSISVTDRVRDGLVRVWLELRAAGFDLSARKVRQSLQVMKASAWLAGRDEVSLVDAQLLQHMAWDKPEDIAAVRRVVLKASSPATAEATEALDVARGLVRNLPRYDGGNEAQVAKNCAEARKRIKDLLRDLDTILANADPDERDGVRAVREQVSRELAAVTEEMTKIARGL